MTRRSVPLFNQMMRAPKKAYTARLPLALTYADFRVLLAALAVRDRPADVMFAWGLDKGDGTQAYIRYRRHKDGPRVALSVSDMIELARRDPQELYDYLHTCYALLRTLKPEETTDT